ncbi:hypothetical protein CSC64_03235 [Pseudoxanthomonas koreensis]|nr:hypothetical protein CSC64_03235 [Pseudoxanthomonas koreensis]
MEQGPAMRAEGKPRGRQSGDCRPLFFCAGAASVNRVTKTGSPARGRAAERASTSDRAGTGGIQISLPDIDMVVAVRVRT